MLSGHENSSTIFMFGWFELRFNERSCLLHYGSEIGLASLGVTTPIQIFAMIIQSRFNACLKSDFPNVETTNMHDSEQDKIGHKKSLVRSVTTPTEALVGFNEMYLTGGALVPVQGVDSPLYALEINPEKTREEFRATSQLHGDSGVKNLMDSMGLGMLADLVVELVSSSESDDTLRMVLQVMRILDSKDYSTFSRVVFDTAPTGHTLRLLSLPDFLDASIGKMMKKIASTTSALKSMFNKEDSQRDDASDKLEQLRERMEKVRDLFHHSAATEFIIVTIPTVMHKFRHPITIG
ncbi:hypothetical protein BC332_29149 [Capsicum chinense]|nr:hypothetical protein BC332_29149 [Capsicum chinense]